MPRERADGWFDCRSRGIGNAGQVTASYRLCESLRMVLRLTIERVLRKLQVTLPTATAAVKALEDLGIVTKTAGRRKNRVHSHHGYIELLPR